jgi:magnesium transporter
MTRFDPVAATPVRVRAMSPEKISVLLDEERLVEGIIRSPAMPHHDLAEAIVQRQRVAELTDDLALHSAEEIGAVLATLPVEEARALWSLVPEARQNEILWELPDGLRDLLADSREPGYAGSQVNAFELAGDRVKQVSIGGRKDLERVHPLWIDLLNPSRAERKYVGDHFGLELPDPGDAMDIEVSSRFHVVENDEIHLHSNFLLDREGESRSVQVAFILHDGILFSVRNAELPVFRLQRRRVLTQPGYVSDCNDLLLDLYGADVEYSADSLEDIYATLGDVGRKVLSEKMSDEEAAAILADIAQEEDLNGRIRSNILDTQRALSFLMRCKILSPGQVDDARQILRDIESLNSHTSFLFDKINFLMDATIGFININQNRRVSQLTFFGVVFMPLNILAGVGGMSEFSMMTQGIPWPIAYGAFIAGMVLFGWATFVALKHVENRKLKSIGKTSAAARP